MSPMPFPTPSQPSASTTRLLSPTRRRICVIDVERARVDPNLAVNLRHAGWTTYRGPATTDARGWIHPGSDTAIDMLAHDLHENLGREWEA